MPAAPPLPATTTITLVDQPTATPSRKVTAMGLGGAVAAVISWVLQVTFSLDVPPGVESAFATIVGFATGYLVRERV